MCSKDYEYNEKLYQVGDYLKRVMILIAGMPGTGKTRYANYLSNRLQIALVCKDKLKEIIWDKIHYDTKIRAESQKYGSLAYDVSYYFCEMLMKINQTLIFESNFVNQCADILRPMVDKYGYKVITVLFNGNIEVIHQRFLKRDVTEERHQGLVSNGYFNDYNYFKTATESCRNFNFGNAIIEVDSTDFSNISYDKITEMIFDESIKFNNLV